MTPVLIGKKRFRPSFGGFKAQNRGHSQVPGIFDHYSTPGRWWICCPWHGRGGDPGWTRKALLVGKEGRKMSNDFDVFLFGAYVFRAGWKEDVHTFSINILSIPHIYTVYIYY